MLRRRSTCSPSRAATRAAPRPTRASGRSNARTARTTSCSPTPTSRRSTSRCRTRCTRVVDQGARRGQARPLREAVLAPRRRGRGVVRRRGAQRPAAERGVHVPAQPADRAPEELVDGGAIGELRLVRSAFSYWLYDADNIRLRTDVEGGALMDVGCYCVSGSRLLAGEPESVFGQAWFGETGTDWVFTGDDALPGRRARALRLRHRARRAGRARGDRQRGLALPRRPVALQRARDRAAPRRTGSSGSS